MSNSKHTENDPERTLITLDQLSQTIEVMTSVVNRLRQHLSEQVLAKKIAQQPATDAEDDAQSLGSASPAQDSFVIEITQHEQQPKAKDDKVLH